MAGARGDHDRIRLGHALQPSGKVRGLADKCEGDDRPECPILRELEGSAPIPAN